MRTDTSVIPASYTELHSQYRAYTEVLVRKWGVPWGQVEDVASTILTRFIERDMLAEFKPALGNRFGTFLGGFIAAYVKGHREQIQRHEFHEGVSCDIVVGHTDAAPGTFGEDRTVYDVVAPVHEDNHEQLEYVEFIADVRRHLAFVAPTNKNDRLDMVAVWDQIVAHEYEHGRIIVAELATHFGVSLATGKLWVKRVREQVLIVVQQRAA